MGVTRISLAKGDIVRFFDAHAERVFGRRELMDILEKNRSSWRLAESMSFKQFVEYLVRNSELRRYAFPFPSRAIVRYTWRSVPFYELILSLKPNCYLTHYTAMHLHRLTEQVPQTVYVNWEQSPKRWQDTSLVQERIDTAFQRAARRSKNRVKHAGRMVQLVNGMHTGNLGVSNMRGPEGEDVRVTDVERTLIDVSIRPEYSGGVFEVLKAYRLAKDDVSVNRLGALLKTINYTYPYHQVIGFYLDMAGYKPSQTRLFQRREMKFDFYLAHQMKECEYSEKWRLYYPKGLT